MTSFALSDIGRKRSINQDFVFASDTPVGMFPCLFIVADGMGGHKAGEYASRFVVEQIVAAARQAEYPDIPTAFQEILALANERLFQLSSENEEFHGMGTTVVACSFEGDVMYVANVGDSRLYAFKDGVFYQITRDHSWVEEMIAEGKMSREDALYQAKKNIITRAVGCSGRIKVDIFRQSPIHGLVLLCSDGLTNMVTDDKIEAVLSRPLSLKEKGEKLVELANESGGTDNITLILINPNL